MEKNAAYQTILHKEQKKHLITIHQVTKVLFHNNRYRTTKSGIGNSSNRRAVEPSIKQKSLLFGVVCDPNL